MKKRAICKYVIVGHAKDSGCWAPYQFSTLEILVQ